MEKIDSFIEKLYGNGQMLQFYLILGAIALFFAVLIIITLVQNKPKVKKQEEVKQEEEPKVQEEPVVEENTELFKEEEEKDSLTDTEVFNNILIDDKEENYASKMTPSPVDNPVSIEEEPIEEEITDNDLFVEKGEEVEEAPVEPEEVEASPEDKTISELFSEPEEEEIPTVQSVEIEEVSSLSEPEDKGPVILTNSEIEDRLAKLRSSHEEEKVEEKDQGLADLMKAVGLEDTMVIPKMEDGESKLKH